MALALGVGLVAAAVVMGPALGSLDHVLPGYYNEDAAGAVYLHHAWHAAVAAGQPVGTDPNQLFPVGTPLAAMHGGNALEMALSGLARLALPWTAWWSAAALAWIPLNAAAFVPLGRHLWGRTDAAVAAGVAWAVSPPLLGELAAGRLTQVVGVGIPLAALGLLRLAERPRPRDRWLAAGALALTGIGYWFYAIFLVILTPIFAAHGLRRRPARLVLADFGAALGGALLLALPFALPVLWPRLTGAWTPAPPVDPATASPFFDNALRLVGPQAAQLQGWLPWVLVPGLVWTAWEGQRRALWLGGAALCALFALGPGQQVGDESYWMPYALLWKWAPFLDRLTHPGRWLGVGTLFLAVAAADAAARRWPQGLWLLPAGVLAQGWAGGALPLSTWTLEVPGVWQAVADRAGGAVIAVPVLRSPLTCRWQPFHHRPLLGGMVEDKPWAWPPEYRAFVEGNGLLMGLWALGKGEDGPVPVYQDDLDPLRGAGFDAVVLDAESWARLAGARRVPVRARLEAAFGEPSFVDDSGALWALPEAGEPGAAPATDLRLPAP